jgi:hypothetical protein
LIFRDLYCDMASSFMLNVCFSIELNFNVKLRFRVILCYLLSVAPQQVLPIPACVSCMQALLGHSTRSVVRFGFLFCFFGFGGEGCVKSCRKITYSHQNLPQDYLFVSNLPARLLIRVKSSRKITYSCQIFPQDYLFVSKLAARLLIRVKTCRKITYSCQNLPQDYLFVSKLAARLLIRVKLFVSNHAARLLIRVKTSPRMQCNAICTSFFFFFFFFFISPARRTHNSTV